MDNLALRLECLKLACGSGPAHEAVLVAEKLYRFAIDAPQEPPVDSAPECPPLARSD
jgi:hypothetical protein